MNNEYLLDRTQYLPKWPQLVVTGDSVSKEQALEIIRRTDYFFQGDCENGSDHEFRRKAQKAVHFPEQVQYHDPSFYKEDGTRDDDKHMEALRTFWNAREVWQKDWGIVKTEYVYNCWISSSFVYGPHGWCHPDGTIGHFYNVFTKRPSVEDVYEDLTKLAEEFPFLALEVTLMSEDWCCEDKKPVISYLVRNGAVELIAPETRNIHEEFARVVPTWSELEKETENLFNKHFSGSLQNRYAFEQAFPIEQLEKWGEAIFGDRRA